MPTTHDVIALVDAVAAAFGTPDASESWTWLRGLFTCGLDVLDVADVRASVLGAMVIAEVEFTNDHSAAVLPEGDGHYEITVLRPDGEMAYAIHRNGRVLTGLSDKQVLEALRQVAALTRNGD